MSTVSIPELQATLESQRAFLNETMAALHRTLDAGPGGVQLAGATNILNYPCLLYTSGSCSRIRMCSGVMPRDRSQFLQKSFQ